MSIQTVLVTGATSGIGYQLAQVFAEKGFALTLVSRNIEKMRSMAEDLGKRYGTTVHVFQKDLSREGAAKEIFSELESQKIQTDILVNNAGVGNYGLFADTDLERESEMIELNIRALTVLTKLVLQKMQQRGEGRSLNVASIAAFQPGPTMAVYYATKAYVLHFSEALSNELEGTGVTVTTLCPGPTKSGFQREAQMERAWLMKPIFLMSSKRVARAGVLGVLQGRKLVVPGFVNKLSAFLTRLSPRWMTPKIVRMIQREAKS